MTFINQNNNITQVFKNGKNQNKNLSSSKSKPDTDYELNWLTYKEAIRFDKRTNCEYYGSLIRNKQLFIFTFCSFNDYNSGIIKNLCCFYLLLCIIPLMHYFSMNQIYIRFMKIKVNLILLFKLQKLLFLLLFRLAYSD